MFDVIDRIDEARENFAKAHPHLVTRLNAETHGLLVLPEELTAKGQDIVREYDIARDGLLDAADPDSISSLRVEVPRGSALASELNDKLDFNDAESFSAKHNATMDAFNKRAEDVMTLVGDKKRDAPFCLNLMQKVINVTKKELDEQHKERMQWLDDKLASPEVSQNPALTSAFQAAKDREAAQHAQTTAKLDQFAKEQYLNPLKALSQRDKKEQETWTQLQGKTVQMSEGEELQRGETAEVYQQKGTRWDKAKAALRIGAWLLEKAFKNPDKSVIPTWERIEKGLHWRERNEHLGSVTLDKQGRLSWSPEMAASKEGRARLVEILKKQVESGNLTHVTLTGGDVIDRYELYRGLVKAGVPCQLSAEDKGLMNDITKLQGMFAASGVSSKYTEDMAKEVQGRLQEADEKMKVLAARRGTAEERIMDTEDAATVTVRPPIPTRGGGGAGGG